MMDWREEDIGDFRFTIVDLRFEIVEGIITDGKAVED